MEKKPRTEVPASYVRAWAREKGLPVGTRGHLPPELIREFNRTHRTHFTDRNPMRNRAVEVQEAGE
jgi:hypothetical protein